MFRSHCAWLLAMLLAPATAIAAEPAHDHSQHQHAPAPLSGYQRGQEKLSLPQVTLVREDGRRVEFPKDMDDGRPVVLNFIYTTCTAICPMLSQTFAEFQKKLGPDAAKVRMVSVSIDPEQDTPKRLAEYAKRYGAGPQWTHYTGTLEASIKVQKAFRAYFGDKMNHKPVVFMRAAPGKPWVRLDGFTTPDDLVNEYRMLAKG
ncbi:MAG TPA: SCO family protein [Burkholderiales bacterium]|nr:SCO family protein [Burkholderiales bacterium]